MRTLPITVSQLIEELKTFPSEMEVYWPMRNNNSQADPVTEVYPVYVASDDEFRYAERRIFYFRTPVTHTPRKYTRAVLLIS